MSYYGYIYRITNKLDGRIYIGLRSLPKEDPNYWGSGVHIQRAIKKYGLENFSRDILEWCETREQLNEREVYWIKRLDARNPAVGYNIVAGGTGGNTYQYLSEEQMDEIRPKLSMLVQPQEKIDAWKAKLRVAQNGERNGMYGKRHSEEARRKMREAKARKKQEREQLKLLLNKDGDES